MDGIQPWSSFEQQQRNKPSGPFSAAPTETRVGRGIDALYVAASSPDVAPAAASLLRHSGLTAPGSSKRSGNGAADEDATFDAGRREGGGEFRLRFHWMRPHPSLAFALEEELASSAGGEADALDAATSDGGNDQNKGGQRVHPAIESAKLMDAYRSSQMKRLDVANGEGNNGEDSERSKSISLNDSEVEQSNPTKEYADHNLPLELPKLRVNLASLVDLPLMSSWLPGEDACIESDSDDEDDDLDE